MRRIVLLFVMMILMMIVMGCKATPSTEILLDVIDTTELATDIVRTTQNESLNFDRLGVKTDDGVLQIDLFKGYSVDLEEPNKYVLTNENDPNMFVRIEWLDLEDATTIETLKSYLVEAYESIGTVTTLIPEDYNNKGLKNAVFAMNVIQSKIEERKIDIAVFFNASSKYIVSIYYSDSEDKADMFEDIWQMVETIQKVE